MTRIEYFSAAVFSPPGCCKQACGLYVESAFVSYLFLNDFCQTNYLKISRTVLRQIFKVGRATDVYSQSETSFSIPRGMLSWQSNFVVFGAWVWPEAGGAAGRANATSSF